MPLARAAAFATARVAADTVLLGRQAVGADWSRTLRQKDLDFEQMGPQVFRFEYYYVLKGQNA